MCSCKLQILGKSYQRSRGALHISKKINMGVLWYLFDDFSTILQQTLPFFSCAGMHFDSNVVEFSGYVLFLFLANVQ